MKKISVFIVLIAMAFSINAQTAKIAGSWLMTKAEINGEVQEPNFVTDLLENGDMVIMDMDAGTWKYNKKNNSIVMKSELDKDFNGENKILNLTEKEMVLLKGEAKLFYTRIDKKQILKDNKASGLEGSWKIKTEEGLLTIVKFELPEALVIVNVGEGYTEKSKGSWAYDAQNESLLIISRGGLLDGTNKLVKKTSSELELENKGITILAVKEDENRVKIERLEFTQDDFYDENEDYKYYDDDQKLPWQDSYGMLVSLENVKHLVYNYGSLIDGTEVFKNKILTADVNVNMEEQSLSIDFIFYGYDNYDLPDDTQLPPNNEYTELLYPLENNSFRVAGTEQITTPAGTFDCTVIEVLDSDAKQKLWMINDKPGIYAKIIEDEPGDWGHYYIYELQEIK